MLLALRFIFICMSLCVCAMYGSQGVPQRRLQSQGYSSDICEPPDVECKELNSDSLKEQQELLTTEPCLKSSYAFNFNN